MSCYYLRSEQVEVEGMDMPEVEGMDMVEEQGHLMNHRLGEEGMNMVGSHKVEVEGMDTMEEHFHPMNHRPEDEGIYTVDSGMGEDRRAELEVVEREPDGMVLARHWIGDGAVRRQRTHREWEELVKLGCSKDQAMFASQDSSCSLP
jgi:hypothetical protein